MGPDLPVQLIVHEAYPTVAPEVPVHARGPMLAPTARGQAYVGGITPMPRVRAWKISFR
ncbi:MAG: hypothetical protein CM1200mP26_16320 [Acidimicrobiales bacterium]|nr:MAG: hypothetical protein CM1200mP26_16320 [Acidimicrobiales bacterium]